MAIFEHSAGGVVIAEENNKLFVLLLHTDKGKWVFPKGNIAPGEEKEKTAEREVREETGIRGNLILLGPLLSHQYFYRMKGEKEVRLKKVELLLFRAEKRESLSPQLKEGFWEALWLPLEEAKKRLTFEADREALKKAKELWQGLF